MADLALGKVRIADLTNVIAGPVSTRVLAQLGAEVIKVELPWGRAIGNITMHASGSGNRPYNQVTSFNEVNRAKKSIAMDLTHEEGRKAFLELVSISDIVIQNYSPRVMANLGLDYENLRAIKPDIIMISMPALGLEGPWNQYISFGPGTDALSGLSSITGYKDGPPHKPGNFYADHNSAFHVTTGIMASLYKRFITGEGQHIEIVLREATMSVIGEQFISYQLTGREPKRMGNEDLNFYPHGIYPCKGQDSWIAISIESNDEWTKLCTSMELKDFLNDTKYLSVITRRAHSPTIDEAIKSWTSKRTRNDAMHQLQNDGVRAGAVSKASDLLEDPQLKSRKYIDHFDHPDAGPSSNPGLPFQFSTMDSVEGTRAPLFAEHRQWVLGDLLGISVSTVRSLTESGTTPDVPIDRVYS